MKKFEYLNQYEKITFVLQNIQVIIGLIGILSNTISYVIFMRKPLKNHSYSFYFRVMSWTDSFILLHTFRHWLRIVLDFDIDLLGQFFCRFNEFQPFLGAATTVWLRNLILFDRIIRVVYPEHFSIIRRKWFQVKGSDFEAKLWLHRQKKTVGI